MISARTDQPETHWFEALLPDALGALIGALAAAAIAFWILRHEINAQRVLASESARRAAFGDFLSAIGELGESWQDSHEQLRAGHLKAVRTQQVWSMHLPAEEVAVGEAVFNIEARIVDAMKAAWEQYPDDHEVQERHAAFFVDDLREGESLFSGLHEHGVALHRSGADHAAARAWLLEHGPDKSDEDAATP